MSKWIWKLIITRHQLWCTLYVSLWECQWPHLLPYSTTPLVCRYTVVLSFLVITGSFLVEPMRHCAWHLPIQCQGGKPEEYAYNQWITKQNTTKHNQTRNVTLGMHWVFHCHIAKIFRATLSIAVALHERLGVSNLRLIQDDKKKSKFPIAGSL